MNTTELARLHAAGHSTREIASRLSMSATTVRRRIRNLPRPEPVSAAVPAAPSAAEPGPEPGPEPAPAPPARDPGAVILAAPEAQPRAVALTHWATPPDQLRAATAAIDARLRDDIERGADLLQAYADDTAAPLNLR